MAQKTAVEWLVNQLIFKQEYEHLPNNYILMSDKDIDNIIEQAKQMEREQIEEAFDNGDHCIDLPDGGWEQKYKSADQYYTQTYGK